MALFGGSSRSPIGIDVGVRHLKAMQLERVNQAWRVYAAVSVPRTDTQPKVGQEELAHFVDLLDRQGFAGHRVVLAVPSEMLFEGRLELPPRGRGVPLDKIAQIEMGRMHKCGPDAFKMAFWDLPASARRADTTQVMAVGCGHQEANQLLDRFEAVGLEVLALDTAAWSLARACRPLINRSTQVTGILDLGWHSARLTVLYDGVIMYERAASEGGMGLLHASLIERTGLDSNLVNHLLDEADIAGSRETDLPGCPELALTVESYLEFLIQFIQEAFSYASHRYRDASDTRLLLVGGGAQVRGLDKRLNEAVSWNVSTVSVQQLVECPSGLIPDGGDLALTMAMGLCQHGQGAAA